MDSPQEEINKLRDRLQELELQMGVPARRIEVPSVEPRRSVTFGSTPSGGSAPRYQVPTGSLIDLFDVMDETYATPPHTKIGCPPVPSTGGSSYVNPMSLSPMTIGHHIVRQTESMNKFTDAMGSLLVRFTEMSHSPSPRPPSVATLFSGEPEEDPEEFIGIMNDYVTQAGIVEEQGRVDALRKQLRGEARNWVDAVYRYPMTYGELIQNLYEEYNSSRRRYKAYKKFFHQSQKEGERAEAFIFGKKALLIRIRHMVPIDIAVEATIDLLLPQISSRLVGHYPKDLNELTTIAKTIEPEVTKEYAAAPRREPAPYRRREPFNCRWCHGDHLNKDCLKNPYKNQENPSRAAGEETRGRPEPAPRRIGPNTASRNENGANWRDGSRQ